MGTRGTRLAPSPRSAPGTRATSPMVATVLLIGVAVALSGVVLTVGAAVTSLDDPPPSAAIGSERLVAACEGCGPDDQVVRLRHDAGASIPVADLELVVTFPGREAHARLVDLPLSTTCLPDGHVEGTDVFDGRCRQTTGAITSIGRAGDGAWDAGEPVAFRIAKSAVRLEPGDTVTVRVVHTPSGTVLSEQSLTAVER